MQHNYILKGRKVVECRDMIKWCKWMSKVDRHVAKTVRKGVTVSTVFLGIDHSFGLRGLPLFFETMVFGAGTSDTQERYSTWEEAAVGHKCVCDSVFGEQE